MNTLKALHRISHRFLYGRPARNRLTVFDDDIFIVSYPKSGNTWVRFLLAKAILGANATWHTIDEVVPDIYRMSDKQLLNVRRPRIIKSHHSYDHRYKKVIYIVRNPEDVLVSYFYFHLKFQSKKYFEDMESFDKFTNDFVTGKLDDFGTWGDNVTGWINSSENNSNILILRYEDIVKYPKNELSHMLNFLGIDPDNSIIEDALNWGSKSNMAKLESTEPNAPLFSNSNLSYKFISSDREKKSRFPLTEDQKKLLRRSFGEIMDLFRY